MAYTKYLMVAGLCSVMAATTASAQDGTTTTYTTRDMTYRGQNYDVFDSTKYPAKRMTQYRQYMNHEYVFPPKPRNQWEIGIHAGLWNILGDVNPLFFWEKANSKDNFGSYGIGAHIRKALGYTVSLRADYTYGVGKGQNYSPSDGNLLAINTGNNINVANVYRLGAAGNQYYFYNYRTEAHNINLDAVVSLTNILFHKAKPRVNAYVFVGGGMTAYSTYINALNDNGNYGNLTPASGYNYSSTNPDLAKYFTGSGNTYTGTYTQRGDIQKAIAKVLDGTYETKVTDKNNAKIFDKDAVAVASFGAGLQFRLSKTVSLSIEDRLSVPFGTFGSSADALDGVQYRSIPGGAYSVSADNDIINYANVGINLNIGSRKTRVEPLYWMNPLDHAYSELSDPRHMRLPDPTLTDSDGDGVVDQFDKCPGTPAGTAVDAHGCPMDTDGDGVPDYRDRQLITPTECQPVDADGVGKCPCNCTGQTAAMPACGNIGANSLSFSSGSSRISPAMESQLSSLAAQMNANPTCKVVITGNGAGSKMQQQRSWDRVNAVIEYMSNKAGIDRNRFIFQYGGAGNESAVMYRSANAGEEGPSNTPPPFPNMRRN